MRICMYMHTCMYAWTRYLCRFMHLLLLLESEFGVAPEFHFALEVPCRCATRASESVSRASALPRLRRVRHDHAQRCLCTPARTTCSSRLQITWFTHSSPGGWHYGKQDLLMITYVLTDDGSTRFHGVVEAVVNQGRLSQKSYHSYKVLTDLCSSDSD